MLIAGMLEDKEILTRQELMEYLSISKSTLRNYINKGYLKPLGMDRSVWFLKSDVLKALQQS